MLKIGDKVIINIDNFPDYSRGSIIDMLKNKILTIIKKSNNSYIVEYYNKTYHFYEEENLLSLTSIKIRKLVEEINAENR